MDEKRHELSSGTTCRMTSVQISRIIMNEAPTRTRWTRKLPSTSTASGPLSVGFGVGAGAGAATEVRVGAGREGATADLEGDCSGIDEDPGVVSAGASLTMIWSPLCSPKDETGSSGTTVRGRGG